MGSVLGSRLRARARARARVRLRLSQAQAQAQAQAITVARAHAAAVEDVLHGEVDVDALRVARDLDPIAERGYRTVRPA